MVLASLWRNTLSTSFKYIWSHFYSRSKGSEFLRGSCRSQIDIGIVFHLLFSLSDTRSCFQRAGFEDFHCNTATVVKTIYWSICWKNLSKMSSFKDTLNWKRRKLKVLNGICDFGPLTFILREVQQKLSSYSPSKLFFESSSARKNRCFWTWCRLL